ncbi:MAG: hypothetical protein JWM23_548 [Microbacteriaceae bacterium]|nr:hypothetical protein [Microbacteriaceae bacterium]
MTTKEDIPQVAPHVFIRGEGGSIFKMDLPLHETIEDRLLKGYLTRVNEDGSSYVEGQDETPALPTERPAISASKATWVGWAVHEGMTPDDAEALTKTDLIEKFGAAPVKTPEELAAEAEALALAEKATADAAALAAQTPDK